ncbi:MAG: hypothetical protein R3C18_06940 [Planctomycetaceae bacterium]
MNAKPSSLALTNNERADLLDRAKCCAANFKSCKYELAENLAVIDEQKLWSGKCSSFREYIEEELNLNIRTVQEILRVYRAAVEHGISKETVIGVGWSKLAKVVGRLDGTNNEQILDEARKLSLRELQQKWAAQSKNAVSQQPHGQSHGYGTEKLILTEHIRKAMHRAARETKSTSSQENLEYVALAFLNERFLRDSLNPHRN